MTRWVITCEHGGNEIPEKYRQLFEGKEELLSSHRGYDIGSKAVFEVLKEEADFSALNTITRLLVELNRSLHHPRLFSELSKTLSPEEKRMVIRKYYSPYRDEVQETIRQFISVGDEVIHISVHTFTPVLDGKVRTTDVGLLYDPSRTREKEFCKQWKRQIHAKLPEFVVRYNYPYRGIADGFVTHLRNIFRKKYAGLELEINQKHEKKMLDIASAIKMF